MRASRCFIVSGFSGLGAGAAPSDAFSAGAGAGFFAAGFVAALAVFAAGFFAAGFFAAGFFAVLAFFAIDSLALWSRHYYNGTSSFTLAFSLANGIGFGNHPSMGAPCSSFSSE